ncbi:MAG: DUF6165 family protein [Candidatus Margulisiibacteriota bacterium]
MTPILVPVAPGELIDKLTILELKLSHMSDPVKIKNVQYEYDELTAVLNQACPETPALSSLRTQLKTINQTLWDIEDDIRLCEKNQDFGPKFIELARAVYHTNDQRAAVKREINLLLKSSILEEKSYQNYSA